jgi:hypothetical protein
MDQLCFGVLRESGFSTEGFFLSRTKDKPRLSSAERSVSSVATCIGLPDSFPSHAFNSSAEVLTNLPSCWTGIPSAAQR